MSTINEQSYDFFALTVWAWFNYDDGTQRYCDDAQRWFDIEGPQTYGSNWEPYAARFYDQYGITASA